MQVFVARSLAIAKCMAQLRRVSVKSKRLAKVDFLAWLEARAKAVGRAAQAGKWQPDMVRKLSGKRSAADRERRSPCELRAERSLCRL